LWRRQFQKLRDGDRFFYGNDPGLSVIQQRFGINFRTTLAQLIAANTDIPASELAANVFKVAPAAPQIAEWQVGVAYKVGNEVTHLGKNYRCRQAHTSQSDWEPQLTPALWLEF
jgi:hypothetical protein